MKKLILLLSLLVSMNLNSQISGFRLNYKLGCGNDVDLTLTGTTLLTLGSGLYFYGAYNYSAYPYQYQYSMQVNFNHLNQYQTIGLSIAITGAVVLLEESIRHGIHKKKR